MTDYIQLAARPRALIGKKVANLRREGLTPVVVYGHKIAPVSLSVDTAELERLLGTAGTSHLIEMRVEGEAEPRMALVRELQRHVTRHTVLHADFIQVRMDETVRSEVPVVHVGECSLVARHEAVMDHGVASLLVEALPGDLPPEIEVDISGLQELGDGIVVGDLDLGSNVVVLTGPDEMVVRLSAIGRHAIIEEEEAAALEAAEAAVEAQAAEQAAQAAEEDGQAE